MRVVVLGAGIIGVMSAWYLRKQGFEVTVVDRHKEVARETSAGNAGVIAPGYVTPWAAPGMPGKVLRGLFKPESPVVFSPSLSLALWRWVFAWLRQSNKACYRTNRARMQRIAFQSREDLRALRAELGIEHHETQGYLQLFRSERERDLAEPAIAMLRDKGVAHQLLDGQSCAAIEPGLLRARIRPAAGLYLPDDEAGDCALFAAKLAEKAAEAGVSFQFSTQIVEIAASPKRVEAVAVLDEAGRPCLIGADAVLVAMGVESRRVLRGLGLRVPILPIRGYSVTLPVTDETAAPRAALMDEAYKCAITRFGPNARIAGTAHIGAGSAPPHAASCRTLLKVAGDWFGQGLSMQNPDFWMGERPMTPDGPPILGPTPIHGLYLNIGHGSTGWAMAAGSGRALADVIAQREPAFPLDGLTLQRFFA
jgi:D-amino-acid dehydrogenase